MKNAVPGKKIGTIARTKGTRPSTGYVKSAGAKTAKIKNVRPPLAKTKTIR